MILPKELRRLHSHRYSNNNINSNRFIIRGIGIHPIEIHPIEIDPIEMDPIEIELTELSYPLEFDVENYNYNFEDVKIGLSLEELISCSTIRLEDSSFFCCICQDQDQLNNIQIVRKIKCNHSFHITCIEKWLSKNKSCPICRFYLGIT